MMTVTWVSYLIVCPALFMTGLINAIGGGGALISLPAYMLAGMPAHSAVATNKLSSSCGSTVTTIRFLKAKMIDLKFAFPAIIAAIISASLGAKVSILIPEKLLAGAMMIVLPVIAVIVFLPSFNGPEEEKQLEHSVKNYATAIAAAVIVGFYDGIYGPGTGTLLIIAFRSIAKMSLKQANGQARIINWTTDVSALVVFLLHGQVNFAIGIPAMICNMVGSYVGAQLVIKEGGKIIKPCVILMLGALLLKMITDYFG